MAALRFADENFTFTPGANRIYINFTDEPNQTAYIDRFSVESLKTDWQTSQGTIHTVFSDQRYYDVNESNRLMSEYTGGTVIYTDNRFSNMTLDALPVTDAMQNSYIIRFTNIEKYMDNRSHNIKITVVSPDNNVKTERTFPITIYSSK